MIHVVEQTEAGPKEIVLPAFSPRAIVDHIVKEHGCVISRFDLTVEVYETFVSVIAPVMKLDNSVVNVLFVGTVDGWMKAMEDDHLLACGSPRLSRFIDSVRLGKPPEEEPPLLLLHF